MGLFHRKTASAAEFDHGHFTPAIRRSICTGEQAAGFQETATGKFHEVTLLRTPADLERFRKKYGVRGDIPVIY